MQSDGVIDPDVVRDGVLFRGHGREDMVLWLRPALTVAESDTLPRHAAATVALFFRYPTTLTAVSRDDGHLLWQHDLTGIGLAAFEDSATAVLTGGVTVGVRHSTGETTWSRMVPGGSTTVRLRA